MTIRILINGANGKMGQITAKTIADCADFVLVGTLGRKDNLAHEIKNTKADVVIDLTNPDAVLQNIKTVIESGAHPVIGTSGLPNEQIQLLQKLCAELKLGGIIADRKSTRL